MNVAFEIGTPLWFEAVHLEAISYSLIMNESNECLNTMWGIIRNTKWILNEMDTHPWFDAAYVVEFSWCGCSAMCWGGVSSSNILIPKLLSQIGQSIVDQLNLERITLPSARRDPLSGEGHTMTS